MAGRTVTHKGTLLFLKRQGLNITQAGPKVLGFSIPPTSGFQVARKAGMCHVGRLVIFIYVYVPANLDVHHKCGGACGDQKNVGSLKLELQTASYKPVCGYRD